MQQTGRSGFSRVILLRHLDFDGHVDGSDAFNLDIWYEHTDLSLHLHSAGVVKLVDARDSKSRGLTPMRVRSSPPAPYFFRENEKFQNAIFKLLLKGSHHDTWHLRKRKERGKYRRTH